VLVKLLNLAVNTWPPRISRLLLFMALLHPDAKSPLVATIQRRLHQILQAIGRPARTVQTAVAVIQ